jgi:magnesium transporter
LLHFRKILLPARAVLADLSTRRSKFISETTQGFLANMVGTVEHVLQDLLVDRDLLSESLNLYMSLVSHRTNEVMKRLTVVSVIFLPLTFLVGVYGMNFEVLPELKWHYGYLFFWLLVLGLVAGLLYLMRRARLL